MGERGEGEERVGEMGAEVALALGCDGICGGDSCVVDNCCDGYFAFLQYFYGEECVVEATKFGGSDEDNGQLFLSNVIDGEVVFGEAEVLQQRLIFPRKIRTFAAFDKVFIEALQNKEWERSLLVSNS